jgi:pimeloyl-ACP methyl ester carboxylesterase
VHVTDVLGVHGMGQQQSGPNQMRPVWDTGMKDGIGKARGRGWPTPVLDIAYYGDLFLDDSDGSKGAAGSTSAGVVTAADFDHFLSEVEDQLVADGVVPAEQPGTKGRLPRSAGWLARYLEDRFGLAGKLLFFGDLTQVRRFQRDTDLAAAVLGRVRELLADGPRVLVGHSLGSIVAYEALCRIPGHSIRTLITLGSPLGLRSLRAGMSEAARERIPKLPPGVERWVNIYDPGDPVALAGGLTDPWAEVTDEKVNNGEQPHAVVRYLNKMVTGEALAGAFE